MAEDNVERVQVNECGFAVNNDSGILKPEECNEIQQIKSDDIVATADIKEMDSRTGLIPISVSIPKYSGSYQSAESVPRNIQIKTEPTGKNVFTLTVSTTGTQRDGYQIGEMKVNPEKISP